MADFNSWLLASGWDGGEASLSEAQRKALLPSWKAAEAPPGDPSPDMTTLLATARADADREAALAAVVGRYMGEFPRHLQAIEQVGRLASAGKWAPDRAELELLRLVRYAPVTHPGGSGHDLTGVVIEAAVALTGGLEEPEKHYPASVLEAAHKRWRHGLSLSELVLTFARRGGFDGLSLKSNLSGALRSAFRVDIQAGELGPSTYTLPTLLSNIANKFLAAGFFAVDNAWQSIAATRSVNDFKQITSFSLTGDLTYDKLPPGGEIKHGTVGEVKYTNQADTYSKMLGIDRRDLINDDLNALSGAGRRLGRGAALKLNDVFWSVFLNNATFFAAGNNNVITGGTSALALQGLQLADAQFRLQTDPDGKPLGVIPRLLVVPTALRATALQLMNSTTVIAGTGITPTQGGSNIWAGMFTVVSSPYMQNAAYTGNSNAAWYLLASPDDLPTIEVCFLNGQQSPTVETTDLDFNQLGIAMRGYHDFGTSLQEFRAGVRAAGS